MTEDQTSRQEATGGRPRLNNQNIDTAWGRLSTTDNILTKNQTFNICSCYIIFLLFTASAFPSVPMDDFHDFSGLYLCPYYDFIPEEHRLQLPKKREKENYWS